MSNPARVIRTTAAIDRHPSTWLPIKLLRLAVLLTAALAAARAADANPVAKACGQKWVAKAMRLEPQQIAWLLEERNATMSSDLDRDGRPDSLTMASHANYRSCDVKKVWAEKETHLRIEYATGKAMVFHWLGTGLVEQLKIYPELGKILVVGLDQQGRPASKWLQYRDATTEPRPTPPAPPIETTVAEAPAITAEPATEIAQIASLGR